MVELNSLVPTIQFTHEIETENSLPFLDVKIIREGQSFKYKVFRKPTNICAYIHMYSSYAQNVKIATFSEMFLRVIVESAVISETSTNNFNLAGQTYQIDKYSISNIMQYF